MTPTDDRQEAFFRDLTRHQGRLKGFVRCLLFSPREVEDVWQNVNVTLLKKADEFEPGTNFWAWASAIVRFQVLSHYKRHKRDRLIFDRELVDMIAWDVEQMGDAASQRSQALQNCLKKLPEPQRQLLAMRYGSEVSLEQIAEQLDRPLSSIRQTLYRIRKSLLKCIERQVEMDAAS